MKNFLLRLAAILALSAALWACGTEKNFDQALIPGHWVSTQTLSDGPHMIHWRLNADGTGVEWDTTSDISEAEGLKLKWTFSDGSKLQFMHQDPVTGGYVIAETFTVTDLTVDAMHLRRGSDGVAITCEKTV